MSWISVTGGSLSRSSEREIEDAMRKFDVNFLEVKDDTARLLQHASKCFHICSELDKKKHQNDSERLEIFIKQLQLWNSGMESIFSAQSMLAKSADSIIKMLDLEVKQSGKLMQGPNKKSVRYIIKESMVPLIKSRLKWLKQIYSVEETDTARLQK